MTEDVKPMRSRLARLRGTPAAPESVAAAGSRAAGFAPWRTSAPRPPALAERPDRVREAPGPGEDRRASPVLERAEALGIPWERMICEEIEAERRLRALIADLDGETPLEALISLLRVSFLQSYRIRDRIQALVYEAQVSCHPKAVRALRRVFRRLTRGAPRDRLPLAEHLWFAYQRILMLQRVSRVAARSPRLSPGERAAWICAKTHCSYEDAAWAVSQRQSAGNRLDAAVARVRAEGFQLPRLGSEALSFATLRSMVRAAGLLPKRGSPRRARPRPAAPLVGLARSANFR